MKLGELCRNKGIILLYHNHDFEFSKMPDGRYALNFLYDRIPSRILQTELDTCWISVSGEDPASYVEKYAGRAPLVHGKDYVEQKSEHMYGLIGLPKSSEKSLNGFAFRAVGDGVMNFPAILRAAQKAGTKWLVVEQDEHSVISALEDARRSIQFLRNLEKSK